MRNKYLGHIFQCVAWLAVYACVGPVMSLYRCFLRCKLAVEILTLQRKEKGIDMRKIKISDDEKTLLDTLELSDIEKLDFKLHLSPHYIDRLAYGSLREMYRFVSGRQRVPLVTNYVLHHVLFNSVFSNALIKEDDPLSEVEWRLPFRNLNTAKFPPGCYFDVTEILVLKSGKLNVLDRTGRIHTPKCDTWPVAKAHVQAQLTYCAPGLYPDDEEIVLRSLIAKEVRKNLHETSILRQLLEPHIRFSHYFNRQIISQRFSEKDTRKMNDPVESISKTDETTGFPQDSDVKFIKIFNNNKYTLKPNLDDRIEYQCFLSQYYNIFVAFVTVLSSILESDYDILKKAIGQKAPALLRENMCDVIATFLWSSSVVHYCDRQSYLQQWAEKYGCLYIRIPLVSPKNKRETIRTVTDGKFNEAFVPDSLAPRESYPSHHVINTHNFPKKDGSYFFRSLDAFKTRCIVRNNFRLVTSPELDMTLFNTEYQFSDPIATSIAEVFLSDLRDLNSFLRQRGEAIVNGEKFTRSVCF